MIYGKNIDLVKKLEFKMDKIYESIKDNLKTDLPQFSSGDTVSVGVKVIEGNRYLLHIHILKCIKYFFLNFMSCSNCRSLTANFDEPLSIWNLNGWCSHRSSSEFDPRLSKVVLS